LVLDPKEDIVSGPFGSNLKSSDYMRSGVPVIRLQNIKRYQFINENMPFITTQKAEELERHQFKSGDIVITKLGAPLGEACIVPDGVPYGVIVADVVRVQIEHEYVIKKYLVYAINSNIAIHQLQEKTKGTTRPRVNLDHIRELEIPLAPLNEQQRIVEMIEVQFTRLDAAIAALERAQKNLERYKAGMLQAACEGRLVPTEAELARAEGRGYESAEDLLERVLAERHERWEEEQWQREIERAQKKAAQAKRKAAGQPYYIRDIPDEEWQHLSEEEYGPYLPKNDNWKREYQEPNSPNLAGLPELPQGWIWASLEQVVILSQNGLSKRQSKEGSPTIVLRLSDIVEGKSISLDDTRKIRLAKDEVEKYKLFRNDLLCIRVNGSPDLVGRVLYIDEFDETITFCDHFIRFRLILPELASFMTLYLQSNQVREYIKLNKVSSAGQNTISQSTMLAIVFPLLPLTEQGRVVTKYDKLGSLVAKQESIIKKSLTRITRMCQKILKCAFEGDLVPPTSIDEPASLLLEHIQAERKRHEQEVKAQKPKQKRRKRVKAKIERRSLYNVLVEAAAQLVPNDLFRRAGFNKELVDEFYEEVRQEINNGRIVEVRPNDTYVYLKAVPNED